jgi:hypothetical protein
MHAAEIVIDQRERELLEEQNRRVRAREARPRGKAS